MKYNSLLKLVLFGFICAFMATSCVKEGPMGPAGADGSDGSDGANGVDGKVSCLACHQGTNMEAKEAEFVMSAHNVGVLPNMLYSTKFLEILLIRQHGNAVLAMDCMKILKPATML